jgi:hypothetical protein
MLVVTEFIQPKDVTKVYVIGKIPAPDTEGLKMPLLTPIPE